MDIPRRKNRDRPDKLTAELLFFCFWLTRCGEVELGCFESYGLENYGQHSPSSYRRYAKELEKCGAIPRMKLRGNNTDGNNRRRFISTITQRMRDWTPARSGVTGSWRVMSY